MEKESSSILKLQKISLDASEHRGLISIFKDWLNDNYKIKVNCLDIEDITIEATELNPLTYMYDISENDIFLHAIEDGIKISKNAIQAILSSPNQSHHYNPITDYFNGLTGKYKGPSQIDYLISCIHYKDAQKQEKNTYIFRKWLYACVACLMGKRQNDVALGLISDRAGIGKTTFFNEILPLEMTKYGTIVGKTNNPVLRSDLFTNKIIINYDEFAAITPANENQFKQLISSETVSVNIPATRRHKIVPRIASVAFTSNKTKEEGGFLRSSDPGMLRRLATLEIDFIKDYRQNLDREQLWAETVMHINGGVDYIWNQEDYDYFTETNKDFVIMSNAMKLVSMYYRKPADGEQADHKSSSDILLDLKKDHRITSSMTNVDAVTIGLALNTLGFERVMKRMPLIGPRYVYLIVKKAI